jgi:WhiB family transcriptional regulator, redox-sensing transcriptional regulator
VQVWKPAKDLYWQSDASCADPDNRSMMDWFFSDDVQKKHEVKNLCFSCPVRSQCLQWALEHRQIWGIWGGKDEFEIRRTLSVSYTGEEIKRKRPPKCPYCSARPSQLSVSVEKVPGGGRWTTAKIVTCSECDFSWRSRTSANAVNSYQTNKDSSKKKP